MGRTAHVRTPSLPGTNLQLPLRVDLTHSLGGPILTAICANGKRVLVRSRPEADIADHCRGGPNCTRADLKGMPREGPDSARQPSFNCEREIGKPAARRGPSPEPCPPSFLRHPGLAQAGEHALTKGSHTWNIRAAKC